MRKHSTSSSSSRSNNRPTSKDPGARVIPGASSIPGVKKLKGISNRALLSGIKKLSKTERETVLSILVHLIEIDRRDLYAPLGFSSLYKFCRGHLGYSESTAGRRVCLSRIIRDYPQCYKALAAGRVSMTNLAMISNIMTIENADDILSRIAGASKRDVKLLVSSRRPRSSIRESITPVYVKAVLGVRDNETGAGNGTGSGKSSGNNHDHNELAGGGNLFTATGGGKISCTSNGSDSDSGKGPAATETGCKPLAAVIVLEERLEIKFGADPEFKKKVNRIRSLLSSKYHRALPLDELFDILMDEYIERHSPEGRIRRKEKRESRKAEQKKALDTKAEKQIEQKKAEKSKKTETRDKETASGSKGKKKDTRPVTGGVKKNEITRHIPRKVRDEVYARDKGCCTYRSAGGRRCGSTHDLQIDHIVPFARGGDNSPKNLRLLCGKHNRLEAERVYGKKHMGQYLKESTGEYIWKPVGWYLKEPLGQYAVVHVGWYLKEPLGQDEKKARNTKFQLAREHRIYYGAVVRSDVSKGYLNYLFFASPSVLRS